MNFLESNIGSVVALSWFKVAGITIMAVLVSCLLVYKEEKTEIHASKHPWRYLGKRVLSIYVISFLIVALASFFFAVEVPPLEIAVKALLVGSFSAVSGAITFDLL